MIAMFFVCGGCGWGLVMLAIKLSQGGAPQAIVYIVGGLGVLLQLAALLIGVLWIFGN